MASGARLCSLAISDIMYGIPYGMPMIASPASSPSRFDARGKFRKVLGGVLGASVSFVGMTLDPPVGQTTQSMRRWRVCDQARFVTVFMRYRLFLAKSR